VLLTVAQVLGFLLFPALVLKLERRFKIVEVLSPVVVCYAAGIIVANLPGLALNNSVTSQVTEVSVMLAIPLLLFQTEFGKWLGLARETVISFAFAVVAISVASAIGAYLFADMIEEPWQIAGMLVGVYTGGTPNMTAIAMAIDVPEDRFILVNAADLLLGSTYLFFLMTVAKPLFSKFLPAFRFRGEVHEDDPAEPAKGLGTRFTVGSVMLTVLLAAAVGGLSVGFAMLVTGEMSAPVIILTLTTLAIGASFSPKVRSLGGSYEAGQYLMLVFCVSIGTLANINNLASAVSTVFAYCAVAMFGSIVIHFALAKFFKVDVDTFIMTSTAAVFGPPFVGPIANVLKNREVVVSGMTAGVLGLAIGNYLGIGMAMLLK
jgi:uncharacterized membrane protein